MIKHKIARINGEYQVYRLFISKQTKRKHWVVRRYINHSGTIGPVERYDRFYQVIEAIRNESNGEESQIKLCNTAKDHLYTIGFKDADIDAMIRNRKEEKSNDTQSKSHTALS